MASDTGWFTLVKDGATEQAIDLGALSLLAPEHAPEWVAVRLLTPHGVRTLRLAFSGSCGELL